MYLYCASDFCIINFIPHFFHFLWIKPVDRWRSSNEAGHHIPLARGNKTKSLEPRDGLEILL